MARALVVPLLLLCGCLQKPFRFSAPPTTNDEVARSLSVCGKAYSPVLGIRDGAIVTQWELSDIPEDDPDRNGPRDIARRYRVMVKPTPQGLDIEVRVELGLDRGRLDIKRGDCLPQVYADTNVWLCAVVDVRQGAACDKDRNCIGWLEPIQVLPRFEVAARDKLAQCMREVLAPIPTPP